jgi:hypothetical protein
MIFGKKVEENPTHEPDKNPPPVMTHEVSQL